MISAFTSSGRSCCVQWPHPGRNTIRRRFGTALIIGSNWPNTTAGSFFPPTKSVGWRTVVASSCGSSRADPLQGAERDQRPERWREPREERAEREDGEGADEDALEAESVAEDAGQRRGDTEGEHVDAQHPLYLVGPRAEGALEHGERDAHDGGVEHDHPHAGHDRRQHVPLARPVASGPRRAGRLPWDRGSWRLVPLHRASWPRVAPRDRRIRGRTVVTSQRERRSW